MSGCKAKLWPGGRTDRSSGAGIDRELILKGCGMLGMELKDVAEICIEGMKEHAEELRLTGSET